MSGTGLIRDHRNFVLRLSPSSVFRLRPLNLFANPFYILGVEPRATIQEVQSAFQAALEKQLVSADALILARDIILDPARRLPHELGYPIDSKPADLAAIFDALESAAPLDERLAFAARLPPLSRANFLGHLAASQPASGALLGALLDAHACVDASEIFETLRALRASAGYVAPSLLSVNQGLIELYQEHAQAAIAGYERVEDAADAVLACTQEILGQGGRYHFEALERLLAAYRHSIAAQQAAASQGIETACAALLRQPTDTPSLEGLKAALLAWMSICQPLVLWSVHQGSDEPDIRFPAEQMNAVIANLIAEQRYDVALNLAEFGRDTFGMMPQAADRFDDDVVLASGAAIESQNEATAGWLEPQTRTFGAPVGLLLTAALCVGGVYFGIQVFWHPASQGNPQEPIPQHSEAEIMPPVGAGQHLELGGVRYCKFQEARLLMIKPEVHGAEETRRFNELAKDYNSRCSDFYYRDADIATVEAEMARNSSRFAADAKRIVSTWPGHDFSDRSASKVA